MLKKIITIAMSAIAVSCIVGCSNQSPVSVNESGATPERSAAFYDGYMQDISGYGTDVWAVSNDDPAYSNGDYYLYYYRTNTSSWEKTTHWGKRIAVTSYGKCYHFNSENKIWCCKMKSSGDSSGYVATALSGYGNIIDIAAGKNNNNGETIWILMSNGSILKGWVTNGNFTGWSFGGNANYSGKIAIAADPSNAEYNAYLATNSGIAKFTPAAYPISDYWSLVSTTQNIPIYDVAACGLYIYYYDGGPSLNKIYNFGSPQFITTNAFWTGVSVDNQKVMFLGYGSGMPAYQYY